MKTRQRPLCVETLERRDTPAYMFNYLSATNVILTGDGASDTLQISVSGGLLGHNRFAAGDAGFMSPFDWNAIAVGVQSLSAAATTRVSIDTMGGGNDTLILGSATAPARLILAEVTLAAGGAGNDSLIVEDSASASPVNYIYTSTGVTTPAGFNFQNFAALEGGEVYKCGTGADFFSVVSTVNNLTIEGTAGTDEVRVTNNGSVGTVVGTVRVRNAGAGTELRIDDSADTSGDTVSISSVGAQTTIAGLSSGNIVYDHGAVTRLTVLTGTGNDSITFTSGDTNLRAVLFGGGGNDSFTVTANTGGSDTFVQLLGDAGADTFSVTGTPADNFDVSVDGGGTGGMDFLSVASQAGGNPRVVHSGASTGFVQASGGSGSVNFAALEGVSLVGAPSSVTVHVPITANPNVVVGDDGGAADPDGTQDAGFSLVSGTTFTPTEIANPTKSLTVRLGNGGDTVRFGGMDAGYAPTIRTTLTGGTGADTFIVTPDADSRITVTGGAAGDTLNVTTVFRNASAAPPSGTLGSGPGSISFSEIESLNLAWNDAQFVVGTDKGSLPIVRSFNPDGTARFDLTPFDLAFPGGVRVASADFTGDNIPDIVVGTGPGGPTRVFVYDGVSKTASSVLIPFEEAFTGGVYVAAGDLNGDGIAELIITPDEGGGPRCRVFDGNGLTPMADFFGIDDPNFRGGARATVGDIDGDGFGDLVISAGYGGGPRVAAFGGKTLTATGGPKLFADFFLFEPALRNGAFIAAGDVNGDGKADLVGGGGPGGAPRVLVLSGADLVAGKGDQSAALANFFAGDVNSRGGVRVATRHLDADARADVVAGAGSGAGSRVTTYLGADLTTEHLAFDAFPGFNGGVFVG